MKWGGLSTRRRFVQEGLRPSDDDCAALETVNIKAKLETSPNMMFLRFVPESQRLSEDDCAA